MSRRQNFYLVARMAELGMTCDELSRRTGLLRQTISQARNLRVATSPQTRRKIAQALDCEVADIFPTQMLDRAAGRRVVEEVRHV